MEEIKERQLMVKGTLVAINKYGKLIIALEEGSDDIPKIERMVGEIGNKGDKSPLYCDRTNTTMLKVSLPSFGRNPASLYKLNEDVGNNGKFSIVLRTYDHPKLGNGIYAQLNRPVVWEKNF